MISWPQQRQRERRQLRFVLVCVAVGVASLGVTLWGATVLHDQQQARDVALSNTRGGDVAVAWQRAMEMPRVRSVIGSLVGQNAAADFGTEGLPELTGLGVQPVNGTSYSVDARIRVHRQETGKRVVIVARRQYLVLREEGAWKLYARGPWIAGGPSQ